MKIDVTSGSMAFNRLDMQISQAILLSIEVYANLDFLLVMDYYDDISLFDDSINPNSVSYYQMKSSDEHFTFNSIIKAEWIDKLYEHLNNPQYIIKELGLITNCSIVETDSPKKEYKQEKTSFNLFNENTRKKIVKDIASHFNIAEENVDLSKFVHIKTDLTINKHKNIAEAEFANFLYKDYPKISYDSIKVIYQSLVTLLTKKQEFENIGNNEIFENIRKSKGVSKGDIQEIIKHSLLIRIPEFDILDRILQLNENEKPNYSLEYAKILADSNRKVDSFFELVEKIDYLLKKNLIQENENFKTYIVRVLHMLPQNILFSEEYKTLLISCIYINNQE